MYLKLAGTEQELTTKESTGLERTIGQLKWRLYVPAV